ncbi:MAG: DUF502 domain-containing protein [bacterium]|nr:DUF502 domain-containing protein [bacterium]
MKETVRRLWATALRGLVALVPLGVVAFLVASALPVLIGLAELLEGVLPFGPVTNILIAGLATILAVVALCFAVGALLGTRPGDAVKRAVDRFLEGSIPLYGAARKLAERVTGTHGEEFSAVEIDLHGSGTSVLGLFVESLSDERCAVFVPMAPTAAVGQVYVVPRDRVTFLEVPLQEAIGVLTEWGVGASKLYDGSRGVE